MVTIIPITRVSHQHQSHNHTNVVSFEVKPNGKIWPGSETSLPPVVFSVLLVLGEEPQLEAQSPRLHI
eukprot:3337459-Amphidinium_carterae.1